MNRNGVLLLLTLSLELLSCTAYRAQHAPTAAANEAQEVDGNEQTNRAANPETIAAFSAVHTELKQVTLIEQVGIYKQELYAAGKYGCCVRPSCSQCALASGECMCSDRIRRNLPACGECTQGWIEGRGNMPGVDLARILEDLGCHEKVKGEE